MRNDAASRSSYRSSCEQKQFNVNSDFTRESVAMLTHSSEYKHYSKVKAQGDSFLFMSVLSFLLVFFLLYVDYIFFTSVDSSDVLFVGAALRHLPFGLQLLMLIVAFFSCSWYVFSVWWSSYYERSKLLLILQYHVLATVALAFFPYDFGAEPFIQRFHAAAPWMCAAPMTSFVVGYLLFYRRFSGKWQHKAMAFSPFFSIAPVFGAVMLLCWYVTGRILVALPRISFKTAAQQLADEAQMEWASVSAAASSINPQLSVVSWLQSHSALYQRAYVALVVFCVALGVSSVVMHVVLGLANKLLPTRPTTWIFTLLLLTGLECYLMFMSIHVYVVHAVIGIMTTMMLIRGFES